MRRWACATTKPTRWPRWCGGTGRTCWPSPGWPWPIESMGEVPLVICGDIHERSEREEEGTRVLTVGSTGATGLGSFTVEEDRPYEAEILHFVDGRLVSLDYVTVKGPTGAFTGRPGGLRRRLSLAPARDSEILIRARSRIDTER